MKKHISEEHVFTITVIGGKKNKDGVISCRNGHEVGDTYAFEYGFLDGFCSKSMSKLYPLMEVAWANGDYTLLGGKDKHIIEFCCPDGVVNFRLAVKEKVL